MPEHPAGSIARPGTHQPQSHLPDRHGDGKRRPLHQHLRHRLRRPCRQGLCQRQETRLRHLFQIYCKGLFQPWRERIYHRLARAFHHHKGLLYLLRQLQPDGLRCTHLPQGLAMGWQSGPLHRQEAHAAGATHRRQLFPEQKHGQVAQGGHHPNPRSHHH